jgi:hypothetical protein
MQYMPFISLSFVEVYGWNIHICYCPCPIPKTLFWRKFQRKHFLNFKFLFIPEVGVDLIPTIINDNLYLEYNTILINVSVTGACLCYSKPFKQSLTNHCQCQLTMVHLSFQRATFNLLKGQQTFSFKMASTSGLYYKYITMERNQP